jgi:plastocyanin
MRNCVAVSVSAAIVVSLFATSGCAAPNGPSTAPAGATMINIVGINGATSFSPNPTTLEPGNTVVWQNLDTVTHRVVLDDGGLDSGNIGPGLSSAPMRLPAPGGYHCTIHPPMIGRFVAQ